MNIRSLLLIKYVETATGRELKIVGQQIWSFYRQLFRIDDKYKNIRLTRRFKENDYFILNVYYNDEDRQWALQIFKAINYLVDQSKTLIFFRVGKFEANSRDDFT